MTGRAGTAPGGREMPSSTSGTHDDPEPLRLDEIEARAAAAPDGYWIPHDDQFWIPWSADDDAEQVSPHDCGRYITVEDGDWHGTEEPPATLWTFLAHSRDDVLTLAAEVRRLRAELGTARQCADYYGEALARESGLL